MSTDLQRHQIPSDFFSYKMQIEFSRFENK